MNRLTKKSIDKYDMSYICEDEDVRDVTKAKHMQLCINRLGEFEDIMETYDIQDMEELNKKLSKLCKRRKEHA